MADILKVYKGETVVGSSERQENGKASVVIENLEADTDYEAGEFKVAWENENGESEKVNVPAFKTKPINVTGVSLNKTSTSLEVGATEKLSATVAPANATNKSVKYSSSDEEVATVDGKGNITAVAEGSADITVTTKDGGKTAKCELTVTAKTIAVTGVTIKPKTASIDVDATIKLYSTVAPSTATNKSVKYSSSDEEVATVSSNGTVTGVAEGDATITVTTQDGGYTDTSIITVTEPVVPEPEEPEE